MKNIFQISLFCITILIMGCNNIRTNKTIVPIYQILENEKTLKISDYAKSIEYIPLKTDSNFLIDEIKQIIVENNYIYILDKSSLCKIFDITGNFIKNIGRKGQGPEEYLYARSMDIHPNINRFYFDNYEIFEYDTNNTFIQSIKKPQLKENHFINNSMYLTSNLWISGIGSTDGSKYTFCIYDSNEKIINTFPNYEQIERHGLNVYGPYEAAFMYRFNNCIRLYKPLSDTIYTITPSTKIEKSFIFDYGKYKLPPDILKWKEKFRNYIVVSKLFESSDYIFLNINLGKYAPESFSYTYKFPDGTVRELINETACALFDKNAGTIKLLNQPIKKQFGFYNDIDNGPPIWPTYITSDNKIISVFQPEEFIDIYKKLKSPSKKITEIATKLSFDDNPIITITTFK